jgi:dTDP-4-amino-4,6-dideoxygalactose transaminase
VVRLSDDTTVTRDQVIESLFNDGIGVSVHYIPLHLHPYWKERYDLKPEQFPHSQKAYERMLTLPLYTRMTDADVERVITAVRKVFGRA